MHACVCVETCNMAVHTARDVSSVGYAAQQLQVDAGKASKQAFILSVAYSSDGALLACGSMDGSVHVFDAVKGEFLHTLTGRGKPVRGLTFLPDSRTLVTACDDMYCRQFDVHNKAQVHAFAGIVWRDEATLTSTPSASHRARVVGVVRGGAPNRHCFLQWGQRRTGVYTTVTRTPPAQPSRLVHRSVCGTWQPTSAARWSRSTETRCGQWRCGAMVRGWRRFRTTRASLCTKLGDTYCTNNSAVVTNC